MWGSHAAAATSMLLAALLGVLPCSALQRESSLARSLAAVGATVSADHQFVDVDHRAVTLGELRGKPLVVSLVYSSCPDSCSVMTVNLKRVVGVARDALGVDSFNVLTLGFDARVDTPAHMASFARARGVGDSNWRVMSASAGTIEALANELGFSFEPSPRGFDHMAQLSVLDADGVIYRQVFGESFDPPTLVEPLKELVFDTRTGITNISSWIDGVRLLCTIYDPASGRYTFDYSIFISMAIGVVCLGWIALFVWRSWREHPSSGGTTRARVR